MDNTRVNHNPEQNHQQDCIVGNMGYPYSGQPWLVEERDACGVGFIANPSGGANHSIIQKALPALTCLEHRGGCSADQDSGDGAGIMTAIPWELLAPWFAERNIDILQEPECKYGVGMVFLPQDADLAIKAREIIETDLKQEELVIVGWREVPVKPEVLGVQARENQPRIEQVMVYSAKGNTGDDLDRQLFLARRSSGVALKQDGLVWGEDIYICSFSCRTIVYKGMVRSAILGEFYLDLVNPDYKSNFAVYHRRFSTNTMPRWPLAQPMRLLGHNGEINTLLGNINWMRARENVLAHPVWGDRLKTLIPFVDATNSDSANLDNCLELLVRTGRCPLEALMIMVPEAYQNQPNLKDLPEITDFYEYYSGIQEPWDGPALLVFSDGKQIGACLDRNGLRPARYCITKDGVIMVSSEAGVVDIPEDQIQEKGRLGPGQMIAVDLSTHEVLKNWQIKQRVAHEHPYRSWLEQYRQEAEPQAFIGEKQLAPDTLLQQQTAFGYGAEDVDIQISDMASTAKEATFCMGDDTPLAVLSDKPQLLYNYFKQRFAQVTNPPIDPLRERIVMSLSMQLGKRGNLLDLKPEDARLYKINSPLLNEAELEALRQSDFPGITLSTLYGLEGGPNGATIALTRLCEKAAEAVDQGKEIIILSDRGLTAEQTYIPPLLAVGAVHHYLIKIGKRLQASLVVETAQSWSTHHFACLVGYGASAICPYMALETVRHWWSSPLIQNNLSKGKILPMTMEDAQKNYRQAVEDGLLKILSKMGISLLSSYRGAQIFEAIGIGEDLLEMGFRGTVSRVGGLSISELSQEVYQFHAKAFPLEAKKLENFGFVNAMKRGEYHLNNPEMTKLLHQAVRSGPVETSHGASPDGAEAQQRVDGAKAQQQAQQQAEQRFDLYELYRQFVENRPATALRDLLDFNSDRNSIALEEVESVEEIVKRFCTGGMSLGALSPEAHEVLAIAMNRLGGKSNSGEGGEDPARYKIFNDVDENGISAGRPHLKGLQNGDSASSAIKQVASGRFGVTPEYLMNAQSIEIKVAQGAKPGEGGQLPGKKVSEYIAMLRRSKPGVTLISPPPHHDIYSIEDLAQLIFDLHQINPKATVSVKLVAEVGIGTIAAGVAKANADYIQISGHDGGTGASPLTSIKHAGSPWELGLTEVHRVLMGNKLRDRVRLRVDGGFKSGWDVVMGALMGAEEFGFGTIAMIAEGCIMARICHTNNCPVGVTSQQERLRQRFPGTPGHVVNFFYFVAEEVRHILARLGYRKLVDLIGRSDLLKRRNGVNVAKTQHLNLDVFTQAPLEFSPPPAPRERGVLTGGGHGGGDRSWLNHEPIHSNGPVLDDVLLEDAEIASAIQNQGTVTKTLRIVNTDRTVGTRIAGKIASIYGNNGFAGQINLNFTGAAGQSFGAFNLPGIKLTLTGEANDYVGKGMHGGEIIIKPPAAVTYDPSENVIIGNTCLYGATGGTLYAYGKAGERFAVRNSLGKAVIEGAGDHCCEYMTGGVVVVLGKVGRNVGAGQTGGLGYFLDEDGDFPEMINPEIVKIQRVSTPAGEQQLRELIQQHAEHTGSEKAKTILAKWSEYLPKFWQVVPPSEKDSPEASNTVVAVAI
jgi:glutamate synthase (ferredoxin)